MNGPSNLVLGFRDIFATDRVLCDFISGQLMTVLLVSP
jgi:hypothetical protein